MAETTIQERTVLLQKELKLSHDDFAKAFGTSRSRLYDWRKGKKPFLPAIANIPTAFPQVSCEWFFRGTGTMFLPEENKYLIPDDSILAASEEPTAPPVEGLTNDELLSFLSNRIADLQKQLTIYNQMIQQVLSNK